MNFEGLLIEAVLALEDERSEEEAKKVFSFIKLNCLDEGYIITTPYSRRKRVSVIAKYLIDHIDEIG